MGVMVIFQIISIISSHKKKRFKEMETTEYNIINKIMEELALQNHIDQNEITLFSSNVPKNVHNPYIHIFFPYKIR